MAEKTGLDDAELEHEQGTLLPERDAMSLIDPTAAKATLSDFAGEPVDPPITTGQGIDEKVTPE